MQDTVKCFILDKMKPSQVITELSSEPNLLEFRLVLMGAQISAPLLLATPSINEIGMTHKPLPLRPLQVSISSGWVIGMLYRYGALNTLTCSWRNFMYSSASKSTEAVSVFPYGETSCWRAEIRSLTFSFLSLGESPSSVFNRFGIKFTKLLWSSELRLLLCSIIFFSISSSNINKNQHQNQQFTTPTWKFKETAEEKNLNLPQHNPRIPSTFHPCTVWLP